jgi:hypothetical protein
MQEQKIKNKPIELLKAVKILINDPVRARYPYASFTKAMAAKIHNMQASGKQVTG